jgi:hypothetical protein
MVVVVVVGRMVKADVVVVAVIQMQLSSRIHSAATTLNGTDNGMMGAAAAARAQRVRITNCERVVLESTSSRKMRNVKSVATYLCTTTYLCGKHIICVEA